MENNGISVIEALNHVQSWLNAGEFDKVIQGCQEILMLEPGNQRALSLLKLAEEKRHAKQAPQTTKLPEAAPFDPLAHLQVERKTEETAKAQGDSEDRYEKRKLFMAMLLPAIVVVLVGGGAIWWVSNNQRAQIIQDNVISNLPDDRSYLEENDQRLEDLTVIAEALDEYKKENNAYPSIDQLESALVKSEAISEVPADPRQGEIDKAGKPFGYVYAVYDGIAGENSVYVLSGLFEDSKGFGYTWTKGAPIKNYEDYRNYEQKNVTFIGGDEDAVTQAIEEAGKNLQPAPETDESGKESGPKVNPNY